FWKEVKPAPLMRLSRSAEIDNRSEARRLMQADRSDCFAQITSTVAPAFHWRETPNISGQPAHTVYIINRSKEV
ncbi:MAG: hypothetical protein SPJ12_03420, partial [Duodenibacillus sp.]|nr:hypothetical protein [Duodenibacillus sp.]